MGKSTPSVVQNGKAMDSPQLSDRPGIESRDRSPSSFDDHSATLNPTVNEPASTTLADLLAVMGRLPFAEACRITIQAGRALATLHEQGVILRNFGPDALILCNDGQVRIAEVDWTEAFPNRMKAVNNIHQEYLPVAVPHYASPEQFCGSGAVVQSNIYSLAAAFYHMLTGLLPYQHAATINQVMYSHREKPPPDPTKVVPHVSPQCAAIIAKAMAKSPQDRHDNVGALVSDIENIAPQPHEYATSTQTDSPAQGMLSAFIIASSTFRALVFEDAFRRAGIADISIAPSFDFETGNSDRGIPEIIATVRNPQDVAKGDLNQPLRSDPRFDRSIFFDSPRNVRLCDVPSFDDSRTIAYIAEQATSDTAPRALHACTDWELPAPHGSFTPDHVAKSLDILFLTADGKMSPQVLAGLAQFHPHRISVSSFDEFVTQESASSSFDLTLCIRQHTSATNGHHGEQNHQLLIDALRHVDTTSPKRRNTLAVLDVMEDKVTLCGIEFPHLTATCRRPLDNRGWRELIDIV